MGTDKRDLQQDLMWESFPPRSFASAHVLKRVQMLKAYWIPVCVTLLQNCPLMKYDVSSCSPA